MWSDVLALVQGGGAPGNTVFQDLSPLQTPVAVFGGAQGGAAGSGPFPGTARIVNAGTTGGLRLVADDDRFLTGPIPSLPSGAVVPTEAQQVFTVDGWYQYQESNAEKYLFAIGSNGGASGDLLGGIGNLSATHTTSTSHPPFTSPLVSVGLPNNGGSSYKNALHVRTISGHSTPSGFGNYHLRLSTVRAFTHAVKPAGGWVHFHAVFDFRPTHGLLTVVLDGVPQTPVTLRLPGLSGERWYGFFGTDAAPTPACISFGCDLTPSAGKALGGYYSLRMTRGVRPFAGVPSQPFFALQGTPNTQGGVSQDAVGQQVLAGGGVWVVPAGVTSISAVCVGTKLSIGGTDVVAATWPVLGDGGGQGGTAGAGYTETVMPPPTPGGSFGGYVPIPVTYTYPGSGGGAGGYGGKGGDGQRTGSYQGDSQHGGGGGGKRGYAGGGVGLKGRGANGRLGSPGTAGSADGPVYGGGRAPHSGMTNNAQPGNHLAWRNNIPVTPGQTVLCTYIGQPNQTGAARIIWGDDRSFPDNAGDV
jgi:hypothetical protein